MNLHATPKSEDTARRIRELGPWFQNMRLDGIDTAPDHFLGDYPRFKWEGFRHVVPEDLTGKTVLDIGCNAGFYALEMARRGASRVVGIDSDPHYLAQAEFAAEREGLDIELRQMSVYDVGSLGERFDLVIFMGVLYHLRHPLLALDLLHEHVVGDMMLFQCMQRGSEAVAKLPENHDFDDWSPFRREDAPTLWFVEERYSDDPTNWFIPNRAAVEAMLRSSGFEIAAHPEREVYMCTRGERYFAADPPPKIAGA
ncbi:TIGR04290 family methyltransferase [Tranquillimonas alkanivorans]|uniref:tRNA (Mo5U34)-methyltransferase n=1 Tax=Tranquillimonas alkanivorans TaxID=441119 RepID=A0A1I5QYT7_9RHOB|nr:TIGR04290 family methyltransferase [Tranquillimonas alkanivorans]SFP51429.1 tRNA (mo5U34)-methyltransferase [Tranquillimonas alkanivorans]